MSKDLDEAARRWDAAERNNRLNPPAPAPDNRPRNALYNRPVPITVKVTVGQGILHSPYKP